MTDQKIALKTPAAAAETDLQTAFPALLVRAGRAACFAADEFFSAQISNPHTRRAYARATPGPSVSFWPGARPRDSSCGKSRPEPPAVSSTVRKPEDKKRGIRPDPSF